MQLEPTSLPKKETLFVDTLKVEEGPLEDIESKSNEQSKGHSKTALRRLQRGQLRFDVVHLIFQRVDDLALDIGHRLFRDPAIQRHQFLGFSHYEHFVASCAAKMHGLIEKTGSEHVFCLWAHCKNMKTILFISRFMFGQAFL